MTSIEEGTNFLRLVVLLLEEGLAVLRHLFDTEHPIADLKVHLAAARADLLKHLGKALTQDQWDTLYPSHGGNASSKDFDITLLVFLLTFPTNQKPPLPTGWNVLPPNIRKNIKKLQNVRNKVYAHTINTSVPGCTFVQYWSKLKKVLLRIADNKIPDLEERISKHYTQPIDPASEERYLSCQKSIDAWIAVDTVIQQEMDRMNERLDDLTAGLNVTETRSKNIQDATTQVDKKVVEQEKAMTQMKEKQTTVERKVMEMERRSARDPVLENMCEHTGIMLASFNENKETFAKLSSFEEAENILKQRKFLVLSGNPGEGKTSTAMHLLLRNSSHERCLVIKEPSDWKHVSPKLFDFIVVEDMFGKGHLNASWLQSWLPRLDDMWRASRGTGVSFIITTRMHVLEECRLSLRKSWVFDEQNILHLSSVTLSKQEKATILEKHLCHANIFYPPDFIARCVEAHSGLLGFPECADLFCKFYVDCNYENLDQSGPQFFERPLRFIQDSIAELYMEDFDKFLALVLVWSADRGQVKSSDLVPHSSSDTLQNVAKVCGIDLDAKTINVLRKTLDSHREGFLTFHQRLGQGFYEFRHKSIADMVGLLYCKKYPDLGIILANMNFIIEFAVVNGKDFQCPEFSFLIPEYLYNNLARRFMIDITQDYKFEAADRFKIAVPHALSNHQFARCFVDLLKQDPEGMHVLEKTSFMDRVPCYGTEHLLLDVTLLPFSLFNGHVYFVREALEKKLLDLLQDKEKSLKIKAQILFFALKDNEKAIVELLLTEKAADGNCLCWAIENKAKDIELLGKIMASGAVNSKADLFQGKTALIVAAQAGDISTVKLLLEHGANVNLNQNHSQFTALHRAIIHRHTTMVNVLIAKGANVNVKGGDKKKNALHFAAEFGLDEIVPLLLSKGASHLARDRKGHTPLHLAAMNGHHMTVQLLLAKDPAHVNIKAYSCAKHTRIKGATALHYAAMHGHIEMLDLLLRGGANPNQCNNFGQTPFYIAAAFGKLDAVQMLENYSKIELADHRGFTPLHAAVYNQHPNVVEYLADRVDINVRDKKGKAPLHVAIQGRPDKNVSRLSSEIVEKKRSSLVKLLFQKNADFRQTTLKEDSSMHFACRYNCEETVAFLLAKDKNMVNEQNRNRWSPYDEAVFMKHIEVILLMRDAGVSINKLKRFYNGDPFQYFKLVYAWDKKIQTLIADQEQNVSDNVPKVRENDTDCNGNKTNDDKQPS